MSVARKECELISAQYGDCGGMNSYSGPCGGCGRCLLEQYLHGIDVYLSWRRHRAEAREWVAKFVEKGEEFDDLTVTYAWMASRGFTFIHVDFAGAVKRVLDGLVKQDVVEVVRYDYGYYKVYQKKGANNEQ